MKTTRSFWRATALSAASVLLVSSAMADNASSREAAQGDVTAGQKAPGQRQAEPSANASQEREMALDTPAMPTRPAPAASVGPSATEVRELQRVLRDQLLYDGNIDGIAGAKTRAALREFQTREQLPVTGTLTQQTRLALGLEPVGVNPSARQPVSGQEGQTGSIQRVAGSEEIFGISQLTENHTREIQRQLQAQGLYNGEIDGIFGPQTRNAIMGFFRAQARGVAEGRLSAEALEFFNLDPSAIQSIGQPGRDQAAPEMGDIVGNSSSLPDQPTRRDAPNAAGDPTKPNPRSLPGTPEDEFEPAELPPEGYER